MAVEIHSHRILQRATMPSSHYKHRYGSGCSSLLVVVAVVVVVIIVVVVVRCQWCPEDTNSSPMSVKFLPLSLLPVQNFLNLSFLPICEDAKETQLLKEATMHFRDSQAQTLPVTK